MEKWREDTLIHYGIKGMKWRNRKKSSSPITNLERSARAYEVSARRASSVRNYERAKGRQWTNAFNAHGKASSSNDRNTDTLKRRMDKVADEALKITDRSKAAKSAQENSRKNLEKKLRRKSRTDKINRALDNISKRFGMSFSKR